MNKEKEKKKVPTWKLVVWLSGVAFFLLYGVVSFYFDIYRLIFQR